MKRKINVSGPLLRGLNSFREFYNVGANFNLVPKTKLTLILNITWNRANNAEVF